MRDTLHLNDFELYKLLDVLDFTMNCILCDIDVARGERKYDDVIKFCDSIVDYSSIYKKIDHVLDVRLAKKERDKKCKE